MYQLCTINFDRDVSMNESSSFAVPLGAIKDVEMASQQDRRRTAGKSFRPFVIHSKSVDQR